MDKEKKAPASGSSKTPQMPQPMHFHAAERRRRRRRRQEVRMVGSVLLVLLLMIGGYYMIDRFVLHMDTRTASNPRYSRTLMVSENGLTQAGAEALSGTASGDDGASTGVSGEAIAAASSEKGAAGAETSSPAQSTSDSAQESAASASESEEASSSPVEMAEAFAQPKANTGSMRQDAGGSGKNHNAEANVYAYPVNKVKEAMRGREKLAAGRIAFLTFDDGVNGETTPLLLDKLKELGVPATFFMVGKTFTKANQPILERTYREGHALALHSFDHDYDKLYPGRHGNAKEILRQMNESREALAAQLGDSISSNVWRYPGGHMSWKDLDHADNALAEAGVAWIDWNSMTGDAEPKRRRPTSAQGQVDEVLKSWKEWGKPDVVTILMHDGPSKTLTRESLDEVVAVLRQEGFSFGILE